MFRFEALGKVPKYLTFCLREACEYDRKKIDNFNHLQHIYKKYEISVRITKYCCNSNGNCYVEFERHQTN